MNHPGDTLARWWRSDDPLAYHSPVALPQPIDGAATAYARGKFWLLGGINAAYTSYLSTVYSYDPSADAWESHDPLPFAAGSHVAAAVIGDWIYAELVAGFNVYFVRYNAQTEITENLGHHEATYWHPPIALDGLIYHALKSPTPHVFDPSTLTWSALDTSSPVAADEYLSFGCVWQDTIVVLGGTVDDTNLEATAWRYAPNGDRWTALPPLPKGLWYAGAAVHRGRLIVAGGYDADDATDTVYQLNKAATAWTQLDSMPVASGGMSIASGGGRALLAGGYGEAGVIDTVQVFGQPPDDLEATLSTDLPDVPVEANLPVSMNTMGGVASYADLLVVHTIPRLAAFDLPATLYVPLEAASPPVAPVPVDSEDGLTIIPPGPPIGYVPRSLTACDQQGFTHALGDGVSGSVMSYGKDAEPQPEGIPGIEREGPLEWSWTRDGDIITTRSYDSLTRVGLEHTELDELMPDTEVLDAIADGRMPPTEEDVNPEDEGAYQGPSFLVGPDTRRFGVDAPLCSGVGLRIACMPGVRDGLRSVRDRITPTRWQLAQAAAAAAGGTLAGTPGPLTPGWNRRVPREYSTSGKTAARVVDDMVGSGGAPSWIEPGVVFVDGNAYPVAVPSPPDLTGETPYLDGSADSVAITITTDDNETLDTSAPITGHPEYRSPPDVDEYLDRCEEENGGPGSVHVPGFSMSGGGTGETFETDGSARLAWTERSGGGMEYTEVSHVIVKSGGRVTREEHTRRGWRRVPNGSVFGTIERVVKAMEYVSCCPQALERSTETVHVAKTFDQAPSGEGDDPGAVSEDAVRWWSLMPDLYLQKRVMVEQRWNAEGWLRARSERARTFDGFEFREWASGGFAQRTVRLAYNVSNRGETNTPVGRGLWHRSINTTETVLIPVREMRPSEENDGEYIVEIVGSNRSIATNSYTEVTDASPPSVSCDEDRPICYDPDTGEAIDTCEQDQLRQHQLDTEAWEQHTEELDARRFTSPRRKLTQSFTFLGTSVPRTVRVGARVTTTRGPAVIARVSWNDNGPRTGSPSMSITVEAWSALP